LSQDVLINEGIVRQRTLYYLAFVVRGESRLVLGFEVILATKHPPALQKLSAADADSCLFCSIFTHGCMTYFMRTVARELRYRPEAFPKMLGLWQQTERVDSTGLDFNPLDREPRSTKDLLD
jgi:hypothetical protein